MTALPSSLVDYRGRLEEAIARDRRRRPGPVVRRLAMVAAATAAAALAATAANVLTGEGPSVVDRAAAALTTSTDGVFHLRLSGSQTTPGGTSSWTSEAWVSTSTPRAERQIETTSSGRTETALADGLMQAYDPTTHSILQASKQSLADALSSAKQRAIPAAKQQGAQAEARKAALAAPAAADAPAGSTPWDAKFRDSVLAMLRSGDAREDGRTLVDGRAAIRIVASGSGGTSTYLVDATTYDPIEWIQVVPGCTSTLRFEAYETLPASAGNLALLSLRAQHPDAVVNDDPAAYAAFVGSHASGG